MTATKRNIESNENIIASLNKPEPASNKTGHIFDEIIPEVFESFFTTKPPTVGTCLGLSVSYFIITENHGRKLALESSPVSGTKFIIRLPVKGV